MWNADWSEQQPTLAAGAAQPSRSAFQAPGSSSRPDTRAPPQQSEASGSMPSDLASLSDSQLYSIIMTMDPPSSTHAYTGGGERQVPVSLAAAAEAIRSAKAAVGAKPSPRDQADDASNSDDEDFNPRQGRGGKNKRVLANRQSAQRSRLRKLQYINDLEGNVTKLQAEIGDVGPQLNFLRDKHAGLIEANQKLRDRVASLMQETQYKDAVNRALKAEVTRMISSGASPEGAQGGQEPQRVPSFQDGATATEGFAAGTTPAMQQFNGAMQ